MRNRKPTGYYNQFIGGKFGMLTILTVERREGHHMVGYCECECGEVRLRNLSKVIHGRLRSCGCFLIKTTTHGLSSNPIYCIWTSMKQRCTNPKSHGYINYGGRGITVCAQWINSPETFIKWAIENGYKPGLDMDRINNDGNYSPDNCRFVTRSQNIRNTRFNRMLCYKGETMSLIDWCEKLKLNSALIRNRITNKWSVEKSFETPVRVRKNFNNV